MLTDSTRFAADDSATASIHSKTQDLHQPLRSSKPSACFVFCTGAAGRHNGLERGRGGRTKAYTKARVIVDGVQSSLHGFGCAVHLHGRCTRRKHSCIRRSKVACSGKATFLMCLPNTGTAGTCRRWQQSWKLQRGRQATAGDGQPKVELLQASTCWPAHIRAPGASPPARPVGVL
jgi:hypothetical protein